MKALKFIKAQISNNRKRIR